MLSLPIVHCLLLLLLPSPMQPLTHHSSPPYQLPTLPPLTHPLFQQFPFIRQAVLFLKHYMNEQTYPFLYVSFNGGKDATVVLFLTLMAMRDTPVQDKPIKCIYFTEPDPFEEVEAFNDYIRANLPVEWIALPTKNYPLELTKLTHSRPVRYVVMGSRKDDPYCDKLGTEAPTDTDKGFPPFTRLLPIIEWEYEQVWTFFRELSVPYCSLYDRGYSSLGNRGNTVRNAELYDKQSHSYRHPSEADPHTERDCRKKAQHK